MMTPIRQAIILAAGQGCRLWPYTQTCPKCLLDIGGITLVEHQVDTLQAQNIDHITVVIGYLGHQVRDVLGSRVRYIENSIFKSTSSMYSLWLARDAAVEGCIVLNSDVLFHPDILQALLESPHPDALMVDYDAALVEEETKVLVTDGRVRALGKTLPQGDAENIGMLKFSARGRQVLFAKIQELIGQNHLLEMVPYAVNAIVPTSFIAAVPIHGLPWIEIDFPEDYHRACDLIYPAILKDPSTSLSLSGVSARDLGGHD
jgi:choline kinase